MKKIVFEEVGSANYFDFELTFDNLVKLREYARLLELSQKHDNTQVGEEDIVQEP